MDKIVNDIFREFEQMVEQFQIEREGQNFDFWQNNFNIQIEKLQPIINFLQLIKINNFMIFNHKNFHIGIWKYNHKTVPFDFFIHYKNEKNSTPIIHFNNPIPINIYFDIKNDKFICEQQDNDCPIKEIIKSSYESHQLENLLHDLKLLLSYYSEKS